MTKDEIIQLAKQANEALDFVYGKSMEDADDLRDIYFANLIAARAKAEEREAIAKMLEQSELDHYVMKDAAAAIRARENT